MKKNSVTNFRKDLINRLIASLDEKNEPLIDEKNEEEVSKLFKKILLPIVRNQKIALIGDYDLDGFFSTVSLETYLKIIESRVSKNNSDSSSINLIYSDRSDGYSMPEEKFNSLQKEYDFFVFLDTGSEYEYLKDANNVVIIDHHPTSSGKGSTNMFNPNIKGSTSTSTGKIVYDMIQSFEKEMKEVFGAKAVTHHKGLDYIKMLSGATILSDMAQLNFENREFLKQSLDLMTENKNNFLFLSEISGKEISSESVNFGLSPLFNSHTRMNGNYETIDSLVRVNIVGNEMRYASSSQKQKEIYKELLNTHTKRKHITFELEKAMIDDINRSKEDSKTFVKNFHHENKYSGINGLLAQSAYTALGKPSLVLSYDDARKCYVGSGRGYGIKDAIKRTVDKLEPKDRSLIKYGGHLMASGVSCSPKIVDKFVELLSSIDVESISLKNNTYKTHYVAEKIEDYKEACKQYNIQCGNAEISDKFYCTIENYKTSGEAKSKTGAWNYTTIYDDSDFLNIYYKDVFKEDVQEGKPLIMQITNTEKNTFFIEGVNRSIKSELNNEKEHKNSRERGL